jgi:hypothetical protein
MKEDAQDSDRRSECAKCWWNHGLCELFNELCELFNEKTKYKRREYEFERTRLQRIQEKTLFIARDCRIYA